MATNYRRGADKERAIVKRARDEGLIAFRSAGSHSPIDAVLIDPQKRIIKLIQCKSVKGKGMNYIAPSLKKRLEDELCPIINGFYSVSFEAL